MGTNLVVAEDIWDVHVDIPRSPVVLFVDYTDTQFTFRFKLPSTSTVTLFWGDGTSEDVVGQDGTFIVKTSNYPSVNTYIFEVKGDVTDITNLMLGGQPVSGELSRIGELSNVNNILVSGTQVTFDVEELLTCSLLEIFHAIDVPVYGDSSALKSLTALNKITIIGTNCTFDSDAAWNVVGADFVLAFGPDWTSATVDRMIKAFKGSSDTWFAFQTNEPRTSGSDSDLETLVTNGNNIWLRETNNIGSLGPELHTDANAMSDPNGNEADATTGWTPTGCDTFESQSSVKSTGSYSIHVSTNATPAANAEFSKTFTVEAGEIYRTSFDWRHEGAGGNWGAYVDALYASSYLDSADITFRDFTLYHTTDNTSCEIYFREVNIDNDGGLYVDNLTLKKVTI